MSPLPSRAHATVVVGARVHGLGTGWRLALERARRGQGAGCGVTAP